MTKVVNRSIPRKFQGLYMPYRYKALYGGRGSAKSHSIADALITRARQKRTRWLCAREIQKSLSTSVHQLLVDKIEEQGARSEFLITREGIQGPHESKFLFAGLRSNPDSIKSMEDLDGVWVEEADRCSNHSLELLAPTLRNPTSELWFSWNRRKVTDPVDDLFLGGDPPPNSWIQEVNWRDNPFFPKVLYDQMIWQKARDRDKWLHIWEGHPIQRSEAKVFNHWRVDEIDDWIKRGDQPRYGADWGFSVDPTVLVAVYVFPEKKTLYVRHEVYKIGATISETPALFAGDDYRVPTRWANQWRHRGVPGAFRGRIIGDSANPQLINHLNSLGFDIVAARKGPGSIREGVNFLQDWDIIVHPSCTHTQDELSLYEYKVDPHTDEVLPELADKDNHVIDSLRYALENERRASGRGAPVGAPAGVQGPAVVFA